MRDGTALLQLASGLRHLVRDGTAGGKVYNLQLIVYCLELIVYSLQLISREFDDNLQISCDFLGDFEKKAYFAAKLNV